MSEGEKKERKGQSFDMYTFFSRKDVILAGILILVLLLYVLSFFLTPGHA